MSENNSNTHQIVNSLKAAAETQVGKFFRCGRPDYIYKYYAGQANSLGKISPLIVLGTVLFFSGFIITATIANISSTPNQIPISNPITWPAFTGSIAFFTLFTIHIVIGSIIRMRNAYELFNQFKPQN